MNRNNYDRTVIKIFDTLGTFFVDTFYNQLYLVARDGVKYGGEKSITEAYRARVMNYMVGIRDDRNIYRKVVKKLHDYCVSVGKWPTIMFCEFEDKVLGQFFPREYFQDFTNIHKDTSLREIIVNTVIDFTARVLEPNMLRRIIDEHLNVKNVHVLQDQIIDIFIVQRENYIGRFVQQISKSNDTVPKDAFMKVKDALESEIKLRCQATSDKEHAINIIAELTKTINYLKNQNSVLKDQLAEKSAQHVQSLQSVQSSQIQPVKLTNRGRGRPRKQPVNYSLEPSYSNKKLSSSDEDSDDESQNSTQILSQNSTQMNTFDEHKFSGFKSLDSFDTGPKQSAKIDEIDSNNSSDGDLTDEEMHKKQREMMRAKFLERKKLVDQSNRMSGFSLNDNIGNSSPQRSPQKNLINLDNSSDSETERITDINEGPSKALGFGGINDDPGFG